MGPRVQRDLASGGSPTPLSLLISHHFQKVKWETREVRRSAQVTQQSSADDRSCSRNKIKGWEEWGAGGGQGDRGGAAERKPKDLSSVMCQPLADRGRLPSSPILPAPRAAGSKLAQGQGWLPWHIWQPVNLILTQLGGAGGSWLSPPF